MIELKPCPFCGEKRYLDVYGIYDQNGSEIGSHITCGGCLAHFEYEEATCQEDVVAAWNRRESNG